MTRSKIYASIAAPRRAIIPSTPRPREPWGRRWRGPESALCFGGGSCGLMGVVARAVLAEGGEARSIFPGFLDEREVALTGLTKLEIVPDMHIRKQRMFEAADAFVALPGGIGTLEELAEQLAWDAARAPRQATGDRRHRRLLAPIADAVRAYARRGLYPRELRDALSRRRAGGRRGSDDSKKPRLASRKMREKPRSSNGSEQRGT